MNSSRPYLIRALYQWIVDNDCTPHLLVNADYPGVQVPSKFVSDGPVSYTHLTLPTILLV